MPGHKGAMINAFPPELAAILPLDSTELPGTGNLFADQGAIREAEMLAAELFGAADTLFSAGGSTLCIQAMLRCALPHGGKLLCGRVLHRAAADAFCLLSIEPIFLECDDSSSEYFPGRVTPQALTEALQRHKDARAAYITCPDYFGSLNDLTALAKICHAANIPLLVDAAHGAHLEFLNPASRAIMAGADFVAQSAHKTLPALTGAAWLHLADTKYAESARLAMRAFGSSSPSFPILLSLDCAREWLAVHGRHKLAQLSVRVMNTKSLLAKLGFHQPLGETDPLRIAFTTQNDYDVGTFLRRCGIEPEYAEHGKVILIPSVANGTEDFVRLDAALHNLAKQLPDCANFAPQFSNHKLPRRALSPREAFMAYSKSVPIIHAEGKISAQNIIPCPPAIPIVLAGEEVNDEVILNLSQNGIDKICVSE
jgi:arginine/lysine/ornithine decarboxylase